MKKQSTQFNLEANGGIGVSMSKSTMQKLENDVAVRRAIHKAQDFGYLRVTPLRNRDVFRHSLNIAKIGGKRDPMNRTIGLKIVTHAIAAISNKIDGTSIGDPFMDAWLDAKESNLQSSIELQWPKQISTRKARERDPMLSDLASSAMQATARSLKYAKQRGDAKRDYDDFVYAQVAKEDGVVLETNPDGNGRLVTGEFIYKPSQERFVLKTDGLESREQQLICLAGAIAIAHADEILSAQL